MFLFLYILFAGFEVLSETCAGLLQRNGKEVLLSCFDFAIKR